MSGSSQEAVRRGARSPRSSTPAQAGKGLAGGMVEKVARAMIVACVDADSGKLVPTTLGLAPNLQPLWTVAIPYARAALEAMREPTEVELAAGASRVSELFANDDALTEQIIREAVRAMIDAALAEGETL